MSLKRPLITSTLSAALLTSSLTGTVTWAVTRDDRTAAAATSQVARSFDPPTWTPPTTGTAGTSGETYDAKVVGSDPVSDIAVLRLEGASDLDTVVLDDDGDPAVGDVVTAVGNANGQGYLSASSGSVVALGQPVTTTTESLTGLIRADAAVVGGYSGGALLDDEGEVVGVTTASSTGGMPESYAIPVDDAVAIAEQIESGVESGDVQLAVGRHRVGSLQCSGRCSRRTPRATGSRCAGGAATARCTARRPCSGTRRSPDRDAAGLDLWLAPLRRGHLPTRGGGT